MILEAARRIKHKNGKNTVFLHSPKEDAILKHIVANGDCMHVKMALPCYLELCAVFTCWFSVRWKSFPTVSIVCIHLVGLSVPCG